MAKTARLKKSSKSTSLHSRAAKRASSPSINLDKSLTSIKAPAESLNHRPSVLSVHHGAGITKKKAQGKSLSRQQRRRLEKGVVRAEAVLDKTERKVERSKTKEKVVKERSAAWEELNGKIQEKKPKVEVKKSDDDEWEDEEMDETTNAEATVPEVVQLENHIARPVENGNATEPGPGPGPGPGAGEEDEIL